MWNQAGAGDGGVLGGGWGGGNQACRVEGTEQAPSVPPGLL